MKKWFTFGIYAFFAKGHLVDWEKVIADLKTSGFTGLSLHIISPWAQNWKKPFFPWLWDGTKFLLNKKNPLWWSTLREVIRLFRKNGMDLELCLFDRYFQLGSSWSNKIKFHPFRNNNIGVKFTKDRELYNSWLGGDDFTWITWDDITNAQAGNWKALGKLGPVLFGYIEDVLDIVADVIAEFPKRGRNSIKVFNEQHSGTTDRHEILQFVQALGKERGLVPGNRFHWVYDLGIHTSSSTEYASRFKNGRTVDAGNKHSFIRGAKMEVHSVGEVFEYPQFIAWGGKPSAMSFSTDGVPGEDNKRAIQNLWTGLKRGDIFYADGKQEEANIFEVANGDYIYPGKDPMKDWELTFPVHSGYLK